MKITRVPDPDKADGRSVVFLGQTIPVVSHSVPLVLSENVLAFDPILISGKKASSYDLATCGQLLGLASTAGSSGSAVEILISGEVVSTAWNWVVGEAVFLNGMGLSSTTSAFGYVQRVGMAKDFHTLVVAIQQPIKL